MNLPLDIDRLTEVNDFGGWWAKREDSFAALGEDGPKGSKVRQYVKMACAIPGASMLVGCSSHSAMQIYVAAAAAKMGVPGIVYTAARKTRSAATNYAIDMGAEVIEVRPGYLSICRSRARDRARLLNKYVRWLPEAAFEDTVKQCRNLPSNVKRIVVPTGSGLTAAAIMVGLAILARCCVEVIAVAVSNMASKESIIKMAYAQLPSMILPSLTYVRCPGKYEDWVKAQLPDGTLLDPYYAAKALSYVTAGDCFWIPGVRPLSAFPYHG